MHSSVFYYWMEYVKYNFVFGYRTIIFFLNIFLKKCFYFSDMSVDNLQYLSSEQALADLAYFHNFVSTNYNVTGSKWVSFGGSYPGE